MTKQDAALYHEFVKKHPSFSKEQEAIDELIAFFYEQLRDQPAVLDKVDRAMRTRYADAFAD